MRAILTLVLIVILNAANSEELSLPPSAKPALDQLTRVTDKATANYNKILNEARNKAIIDLQEVMKSETKKGNLDGALAIRTKIEAIEKQMDDGKDLLGNKIDNPEKDILGTWHVTRPDGCDAKWVFTADKKAVGPGYAGVWSLKDNTIRIIWNGNDGMWDAFHLPITDNIAGDGHGIPNGSMKGVRIPDKSP